MPVERIMTSLGDEQDPERAAQLGLAYSAVVEPVLAEQSCKQYGYTWTVLVSDIHGDSCALCI